MHGCLASPTTFHSAVPPQPTCARLRPLAPDMTVNCPKCKRMEAVEYEKVEIDRCTSCGGLWFDALEQQDLQNLKGERKLDAGDAKTGKQRDRRARSNARGATRA